MSSFLRALKRFGRAMVSILIAGASVYVTQDEKLIVLAPILAGIGKWLRDKLGLKYIPF